MRLATPGQRNQVWTDENVEALCQAANAAGRRFLALALRLGLWLGQREADILKMGWDQVADDLSTISIEQQKTGTRIIVRVTPELKPWIAETPRSGAKPVVSETTNLPYGEHNFRHLYADIRSAAKLDASLLFMDPRRSPATRRAQSGRTSDEIRAITGHKSLQILNRYVRVDDTLARSAIKRLVANRTRT
jgi:integrase